MRNISLTGMFILVFYSSTYGQVPDSLKFSSLLPVDFQLAYQNEEKAILIDVREFFEFRTSRLIGAVNIPSSRNLEFVADSLKKDSALFLYCTSGYRSKRVAKYFYDAGFRRLYSLEGGIVAWKKQRMAIDRKRIRRHDLLLHK